MTGTDALVLAESITLDSVSVLNTGKSAANICTVEDGDITILHRVDVENATLTAGGNLVVDADQVLESGFNIDADGPEDIMDVFDDAEEDPDVDAYEE